MDYFRVTKFKNFVMIWDIVRFWWTDSMTAYQLLKGHSNRVNVNSNIINPIRATLGRQWEVCLLHVMYIIINWFLKGVFNCL